MVPADFPEHGQLIKAIEAIAKTGQARGPAPTKTVNKSSMGDVVGRFESLTIPVHDLSRHADPAFDGGVK